MFSMFSKPLKKWLYFVFGKKVFLVKIEISTILAKRIDQGNENEEKKNPNINKLTVICTSSAFYFVFLYPVVFCATAE